MFSKICALKYFANFNGKYTCVGVSFSESFPQACNFIKMRLQRRYFPVKFAKFSRAGSFTKHLRWLLFKISYSNNLFKDFSAIPEALTMTS